MPNYCIATTLSAFGINISTLTTKRLINNSLEIKAQDVFCAVIGHHKNGCNFINSAIENGAACVIAQVSSASEHGNVDIINSGDNSAPVIAFYQLNEHLFSLAQLYYQVPNKLMKLVGITGTNGKTTTASIISQLLNVNHKKEALIGTLGAGRLNHLVATNNTTPAATELMQLMADFAEQGVEYLSMEVSSHALVQKRVSPDIFDVAVFMNLSRDHLDYHQTMEAYAKAKFSLFTQQASQKAVINGDDPFAINYLNSLNSKQLNYVTVFGYSESLAKYSQFIIAEQIKYQPSGVSFFIKTHLGNEELTSPLLGAFNVENLLAAIAVLLSFGFTLSNIKTSLHLLKPINGRMEKFAAERLPTAIVDYAHTPNGLENALKAVKQHFNGKLWLVFGCGGDRDQGKRAGMGRIAEQYADEIIVTNDNPRHESPENIVADILQFIKNKEKFTVELDRAQAVEQVFKQANKQDCILFAGKGHEDYILIGNEKLKYNERQLVKKHFQEAVL